MTEPTETKSNGGMKTVLIVVGILLILCVCCVVAFLGFTFVSFGAAIGVVNTVVTETVCDLSDVDAATVYANNTTAEYRSRVTEQEFATEFAELNTSFCGNLENFDIFKMLSEGWNISFETENGETVLLLDGNIEGKALHLRMVGDAAGEDLKIDELSVQ